MKPRLMTSLRESLRWALGLILVWAAVSKLANLQEFYGSLLAYQLSLPATALRLAAVVLPWLELLCGVMLLTRVWIEAAMAWTSILFAIFVVSTGQAWARGLDISCGCLSLNLLGLGESAFFESVGFAFFRALLLAAGAIYLLRRYVEPRRASGN